MNNKELYRSDLPSLFYFLRWLILIGFVFLIIFRVNYLIILIVIIPVLGLIDNDKSYTIVIYNDYFIMTLPSFYGKKFQTEKIYYYRDITDFVFIKGKYDLRAAIFGEIIGFFFPQVMMGFLFAYERPKIEFMLKNENQKTEFEFNNNQTTLLKAIEFIQDRLRNEHELISKSKPIKHWNFNNC